MRAFGVDISKWVEDYEDDGIDEGWPRPDFVIQKAANGTYYYPGENGPKYWEGQYNSIADFAVRGSYHWFETEQDWKKQAEVGVKLAESGLYDFVAIDYEAYRNVISKATALNLQKYVDYYRANTDREILVYTNGWIRRALQSYLGAWMNSVDFWYAGGLYYNSVLPVAMLNIISPAIDYPWKFWQFSADKNMLADELDFGTSETGSIDLNVYNGTVADLYEWLGIPAPNPPPLPPSDTLALRAWQLSVIEQQAKIDEIKRSG